MTRPARSTFRQQITVTVGLLSLALVLATAIGAATVARRQAVQAIGEEMAELAANMATTLDRGLAARLRDVTNVGALEPLRDRWLNAPDEVRSVLAQLQATEPDYAWIGFADAKGVVRAATQGMLEGASVAARPWYQNATKAPFIGDLHEAQLLANLLAPLPNGDVFRFVDVAVPVFDRDRNFIGVLGAHLSWSWAEEVKKRFLGAAGPDEADIWILSADGAVILGPAYGARPFDDNVLARMRTQRRGVFETNDALAGYAATSGHRGNPGLGWTVVARKPTGVAFARANELVAGIVMLGLWLACVGVILVWWLAGRLARPMGELTRVANEIGRNPDVTMMPRLDGTSEMVQLSAALRALLRRLGSAEQEAADATQRSALDAQKFAREMDVLRAVADADPLTGLANRRAFLAAATDAMTYYQRYGRNIAVLVADIDFFKRINDSHGHSVGDQVIRGVGDALQACVRATDKVARFGGEEFVILLREIGEEGVQALAERMRQAVRSTVLIENDRNICVTVSIGAAVVREADRDIQDLIERADHALYEAKNTGRNRVVLDQPRGADPERAAA